MLNAHRLEIPPTHDTLSSLPPSTVRGDKNPLVGSPHNLLWPRFPKIIIILLLLICLESEQKEKKGKKGKKNKKKKIK